MFKADSFVKRLTKVVLHAVFSKIDVCFRNTRFSFVFDKHLSEDATDALPVFEVFVRAFELSCKDDKDRDRLTCDCHLKVSS